MPFTRPCFKRHVFVRRGGVGLSDPFNSEHTLGFSYGRTHGALMEDVDETQMQLLSLLDDQHSFTEIVLLLQKYHPNTTAKDVSEALDDLVQFGLLEDASIQPPAHFTAAYLARYESQLHFLSALDNTGTQKYTLQARLKNARVAVLGLGGLGSNVLLGLAAIGVGFLRGVDFDIVEMGNLNRQVLYDIVDIGKPKVLAAAEQLTRFNPEVIFEAVQSKIESFQDIIDLIKDVDLVALCADLPPSIDMWMNKASLEAGIPFISGGYRGAGAEVGPFVIPYETGCLACSLEGEADPREIGKVSELAWLEDAFWQRHPNIHFLTALAANFICSDICKHITRIGSPATLGHFYMLDIEQFTLTPTARPRSPQCSECGQGKLAIPFPTSERQQA